MVRGQPFSLAHALPAQAPRPHSACIHTAHTTAESYPRTHTAPKQVQQGRVRSRRGEGLGLWLQLHDGDTGKNQKGLHPAESLLSPVTACDQPTPLWGCPAQGAQVSLIQFPNPTQLTIYLGQFTIPSALHH